jgi:RNA recognition motif-containing protein
MKPSATKNLQNRAYEKSRSKPDVGSNAIVLVPECDEITLGVKRAPSLQRVPENSFARASERFNKFTMLLTLKFRMVNMKIFVGNLPRSATSDTLRQEFEKFGQVASVDIVKDKFSGESKGFGFVEMPSTTEAQAAISGLSGHEVDGKSLTVNEARPRNDDRRGGNKDPRGGGGYRRS